MPALFMKGRFTMSRRQLQTRHSTLSVAVLGAFGLGAVVSSVKADSLDLGVNLNYAVVDLASGKTIHQNSGPIAGNELLGNGVTAAFSGGANKPIGKVFFDPTVLGTNTFSQFQPAPTTVALPDTTLTTEALNSAVTVADTAAKLGLTPTQTFTGTLSSATTIHGNGGLNVIDVDSIQNAPLTIQGSLNDFFVFNVAGSFNTNVKMVLSGVGPDQILWNFTGTSGNVFQTSGGNSVFGTFLATKGGNFQFSNLDLNGALINTAGDVAIVSGSGIPIFTPLPLPGVVPASLFLLGGLFAARKLRLGCGSAI